jgi:hypothetical protein
MPFGVGSVLLIDAFLILAAQALHPAASTPRLLTTVGGGVAVHLVAALVLASEFKLRGMLHARRGVVGAILTTLLFTGSCVAFGVFLTFA